MATPNSGTDAARPGPFAPAGRGFTNHHGAERPTNMSQRKEIELRVSVTSDEDYPGFVSVYISEGYYGTASFRSMFREDDQDAIERFISDSIPQAIMFARVRQEAEREAEARAEAEAQTYEAEKQAN